MKLHLPATLRKAVLACLALAGGITTTVGTGVVAGGTLAVAMVAQQAMAELTSVADMDTLIAAGTSGTGVVSGKTADNKTVSIFSGSGAITGIASEAVKNALNSNSGFLTIAAWVKEPNSAGNAFFGIGGQHNGIKFGVNNNRPQVTYKGVADYTTGAHMAVPQNEWTLVAVTINLDKTDAASYFFTGKSGANPTQSGAWSFGTWTAPSPEQIAIGSGNGENNRELFYGMISELTIFTSDTAATANELKAKMGSSFAQSTLTWDTAATTDNQWNSNAWQNGTATQGWTAVSNAVFSGAGETISLSGDILADTMSVTGTGWEWSGDGNIAGYQVKVGDGTTAADLTISTTGKKTFGAGVLVAAGSTLTVQNADNWNGPVAGEGTVELAIGGTTQIFARNHVLMGLLGIQANTLGTLKLTNGTVVEHGTVNGDYWRWMTVANTIDITEGSRITFSTGGNYLNSGADSLYRIAGTGTTGEAEGTEKAAALSFTNGQTVMQALELADDATLYVAADCGAQFRQTPVGDGYTLTKTGAGTLTLGQSGQSVAATGNPDISVAAGKLAFALAAEGNEAAYDGAVSLADGTTLQLSDGSTAFTGGLSFDGNVILNTTRDNKAVLTTVAGDADTVVSLKSDQDGGDPATAVFGSANTFEGTWKTEGKWVLRAEHEQAFEHASVNLDYNDSSLLLVADKVKIGSLTGNGVLECKYQTSPIAEFCTTGTAKFTGAITPGISIVMNGPGEQILSSFDVHMAGFKADVTVSQGTLTVEKGIWSAARTVTLAQGSTLNNALTLNGGSLVLDLTGQTDNAASLNGNTLALAANSGTALSLSLADNVKTNQTFTLLKNISGLTLAANSTVGDYFTMDSIDIVSDNAVKREDLTLERLAASALFVEDNALKLTLAPSILAESPLYWDTADGTGNGDWSSNNWSAEDALGIDPGKMADDWKGSVVFSDKVGDTTRPDTVNVDTNASVENLTVEGGHYIFTRASGASLSIAGTLDVQDGATADMTALGDLAVTEVTNAGTLSTAGLEVATGLTQTAGSLSAGKISGTGNITVTGGTLELKDNTDALAVTGSVSIKDTTLAGTWAGDGLSLGAATMANGADVTLSNVTVSNTINTDAGTLTLSGKVVVDTAALEANGVSIQDNTIYNDGNGNISTDNNGYAKTQYVFALATDNANLNLADTATWESGGTSVTAEKTDGENTITLSAREFGTKYFARKGEVNYNSADSAFSKATALVMDGGNLALGSALAARVADGIRVQSAGTITLHENASLSAEQIDNTASQRIELLGSGTYNLKNSTGLGAGISLGASDTTGWWTGTVSSSADSVADVSSLGNARSTVQLMANVNTATLSTGNVGTLRLARNLNADTLSAAGTDVQVSGTAALRKGDSRVRNATFAGGLTLGSIGSAATLTGESLSLSSLTIGSLGSTLVAGELTEDKLDIRIDRDVLSTLPSGDNEQLVRLAANTGLATLSFNGEADCTLEEEGSKYFYTLRWVQEELPGSTESVVILTSTLNENFIQEKFRDAEDNAQSGTELLNDAFVNQEPHTGRGAPTDLGTILEAVENNQVSEDDLAAVAGASVATLGMALSGDVERQLRAIRNRTTTMGVNPCVYNEHMPYYNAWVNAEGNHSELSSDGNMAGYKLDSWGGTIGFDVDMNDNLTMGLAITAMYGDLQADGPETKAEGDLDTYYVSLFARYASCAWTHTFVATLGMMDGSFDRTVDVGRGYSTEGSTDGMGFGLLYELGYVVPLDYEATTCLQPVFNVMLRHSSVGSYTEEGSDAALDVGSQSMTTVTFGLGARLQAVVGENLYNRSSIFEARVLGKVDVGDRSSEADVAFVGANGYSSTVESAELGAFGVELGAGLTIPLGAESGSLFVDGSAELRSGYTNFNGTVGYRIQF